MLRYVTIPLHYVRERYQIVEGRRVANKAVCGDQDASADTLTLSDVSSIITCPACRDEIRKLEAADPEKLELIENAWSPSPKTPVWDEGRARWVLPK